MRLSGFALALLAAAAFQDNAAAQSFHANADHTVTFHLRAPQAQKVEVEIEGERSPLALSKAANGEWSGTSAPLAPNLYGYSFDVDGVRVLDSANPEFKANLMFPASLLLVPGTPPEPWELTDVPHGELHHRVYKSQLIGDQRDFYVYTPPGYDARSKKKYPVLYLLHGFSDDASGWSLVGKAGLILDNLIAQGKSKPMLVVMPLGYGAPEILQNEGWNNKELMRRNLEQFTQNLLEEVIPMVQAEYRASSKREDRAIAGLSIGGAEALLTALNHPGEFAWVGGMSTGGLEDDLAAQFPQLGELKTRQMRLVWIACGKDDGLAEKNRKLEAWLQSQGVAVTAVETEGGHSWMVWRKDLVRLAPLLFR